jgi:hypothetical protein
VLASRIAARKLPERVMCMTVATLETMRVNGSMISTLSCVRFQNNYTTMST